MIDDFHYLSRDVQLAVVRALKELIVAGLRVIALAVPHRGFDVPRVENEMTGRVVVESACSAAVFDVVVRV